MFKVDKEEGLTLIEVAEGVELEDVVEATGCEFKVRTMCHVFMWKDLLILNIFA